MAATDMETTVQYTLEHAQWIAVWASMLFTLLSACLSAFEPDWRKKKLLRDIQLMEGVKEFADPHSFYMFQRRIGDDFENICKPQAFNTPLRLYYAFYYISNICFAIWASYSHSYLLLTIALIGIALVTAIIIVGRNKVKRTWKEAKENADDYMDSLSESVKPNLKTIAEAIRKGMPEEEIERALFAEERAAKLYANMFAQRSTQKRYIEQALTTAVKELSFELFEEASDLATRKEEALKNDMADMDPDLKSAYEDAMATASRSFGKISEKEKQFFEEMDDCLARTVLLIQDMEISISQQSYSEYYASRYKEFFEIIPVIKEATLKYDPYVNASLLELYRGIAVRMQTSSDFWTDQEEKLSRGDSNLDKEKASSLYDALILHIVAARAMQSRYIAGRI